MLVQTIVWHIDGYPIKFCVVGDAITPKHEYMCKPENNLLQLTPWNEQGYTIQPFLPNHQFLLLQQGLKKTIGSVIASCITNVNSDFSLNAYHNYVDDVVHQKVVSLFQKPFLAEELPVPIEIIENRISEIIGVPLTTYAQNYGKLFFIRIVRPLKSDFNPPHRDVYIDRLKNALNLYIPLWGSNQLSSLPIMPGSHLLSESDIKRTGSPCTVNNTTYTVPCITGCSKPMELIRPNPTGNEVLIFSPYLIHGGAINLNEDTTRYSLEIRLWRK